MFAALNAAAEEIPTVRRFHVGARVTHGATYEKLMPQDFPFAAVIEFDDLAALDDDVEAVRDRDHHVLER